VLTNRNDLQWVLDMKDPPGPLGAFTLQSQDQLSGTASGVVAGSAVTGTALESRATS
jgi:hypothetical protein